MFERGVVAGDAVELLGALVRGNGDERATGAGGVVRELADQAAQAREPGTADALGEGRKEEDRVCVATHDCAMRARSLPADPCRGFTEAAPPRPRTGRRPRRLPRAAPTRRYESKSGSRRNTRPSDWGRNGRSPSASSRCAREVPRRPPRFRRGGRGDLDEVGGSHGRPEFRRTEGLATTRDQRPRHITLQAARIAPTRAAALESCRSAASRSARTLQQNLSKLSLLRAIDCDEMMPSALLSFR